MITKISIAFMLSGLFVVGTGYSTVSAVEPEVATEEVFKSDSNHTVISDEFGRSTVTVRGQLNGSNPVVGKPRATATTSANKTVNGIRARVNSNNNGTGTSTSGWTTQSNTTLARSNQLIATTNKARFTGNHQVRISKNGSWQGIKDTSISY